MGNIYNCMQQICLQAEGEEQEDSAGLDGR